MQIMRCVTRLVRSYLEGPGARSVALGRIAVAVSLLLVLARHVDTPLYAGRQPAELYHPVGAALLVAIGMITPALLYALLALASVATLAALVGWYARVTFAVGYLSTLLLVSVSYSFTVTWSHGESATFLAGLPLLFARVGDAWSVDARRQVAPPLAPSGMMYGIPLRGAQAMLALYFFNAVYWKLTTTGLEWAFSDNLRQIFALRYLVIGDDPPWVVSLALDHPWIAQAMAVGNLVLQATPMLLLPLLRWRAAQVLAAAAFIMEALGLTVVMGLFGGEMIPLGVLFLTVDRQRVADGLAASSAALGRRVQGSFRIPVVRVVGLVVAVCVAAQAFIAWSRYDHVLRSYPFTATPMYSGRYGPVTHRLSIEMRPGPPVEFRERVRLLYTGDLTARDALRRRAEQINAEHVGRYGKSLDEMTIRREAWDITDGQAHVVTSTVLFSWSPGTDS